LKLELVYSAGNVHNNISRSTASLGPLLLAFITLALTRASDAAAVANSASSTSTLNNRGPLAQLLLPVLALMLSAFYPILERRH
jgi:hypothetical protein